MAGSAKKRMKRCLRSESFQTSVLQGCINTLLRISLLKQTMDKVVSYSVFIIIRTR